MSSKTKLIRHWRQLLGDAAGPRHWWPGETVDEIIIGAVLTQNTAWSNVEKAIARLKECDLCSLDALAQMKPEEFAPLIRSSGYYNLKAKRLHAVARFFADHPEFKKPGRKSPPTPELRAMLLGVKGVGRETADSILLYALDRLTFVVDTYTIRVMSRHGLCSPTETYERVREFLQEHAPRSVKDYNEFHALFVWVGHHFCKPRPLCSECPLFRRDCCADMGTWKKLRDGLEENVPTPRRISKREP